MSLLHTALVYNSICGCWRPLSWISSYKETMYNVYSIFASYIINTFVLFLFIDASSNMDNVDDFADNLYMIAGIGLSCWKMFSLLMARNNVNILLNMLVRAPCKSENDEEAELIEKCEKNARTLTHSFAFVGEIPIILTIAKSLLNDCTEKKFIYSSWTPYDATSSTLFFLTYLQQMLAILIGALIHVAVDSLIFGLLMHLSCQIEILKCRLRNVKEDNKVALRAIVYHHNCIYLFAATFIDTFKTLIFFQFFENVFIACFNLYQMSLVPIFSSQFLSQILYTSAIQTEIFLYCWFGNQVRLKSQEIKNVIFNMDWPSFDKDAKRSLLIMMNRTMRPIELRSASVIDLNLESFVGLLKTSYSAYNVLQQRKENQ